MTSASVGSTWRGAALVLRFDSGGTAFASAGGALHIWALASVLGISAGFGLFLEPGGRPFLLGAGTGVSVMGSAVSSMGGASGSAIVSSSAEGTALCAMGGASSTGCNSIAIFSVAAILLVNCYHEAQTAPSEVHWAPQVVFELKINVPKHSVTHAVVHVVWRLPHHGPTDPLGDWYHRKSMVLTLWPMRVLQREAAGPEKHMVVGAHLDEAPDQVAGVRVHERRSQNAIDALGC